MRRASLLSITSFLLACGFVECAPNEPMAGPSVSEVPKDVASGIALEVFARGLKEPVAFAFAPGDPKKRLFVCEKPGRVVALDSSGKLVQRVLDISDKVSNGSEQGLLGLTFHPKWAENGLFYIHYTDRKGDNHVVEYKLAGDAADAASAREVLKVEQPYSNHNGGHVIFGPDGRLWIGFGDGGWAGDPHGNGQREGTLLGKMVALAVDSAAKPAGVGRACAPAGGAPPAVACEVVQKGHRNPWRYQFDRKTGDLYVADVGQNLWEEVHVVPSAQLIGANLGWNVMEGNHCYKPKSGCDPKPFLPATVEYSHKEGCSITGGFVYRGKALPKLDGHYFYADYCTGLLRSFRWQGTKGVTDSWDWKERLDPSSKLARLSSFGEDESGELYLLSQDGLIYKFVPKP